MWGTESWGLVALAGAGAFAGNIFYLLGGTAGWGKFWRRFVGAAVLAGTANFVALALSAWTWQYLLMFPALMVAFSQGYSVND